MSGNTKDGLDSLPLGREKFARIFSSSKERGGGNTKFCKITDSNHGDLPLSDICRLQTADCRLQIADCRLQTADCRLQTKKF